MGDRFSDQFVLTKQETDVFQDFIPDFKIDLFDLKGIELKKKLESITFSSHSGSCSKNPGRRFGIRFSPAGVIFPITWNRGRIEKGCNPTETVVVYLLGP
ncbi:hypothetical protein LEP1GSC016_2073 [Leptospira borgpetersenii serovar Hardjo-bovis str. Sponselee]|uniref:Uncharacterized protein n=1 Tax=Leptospira borgpetersenii serovar Hardjo-bovis str. Sponselee TaxID=1303729 RepID=M6BT08_LEPBO|nr:hypothetical protein LEP1GSC016_2073 [Leptospira borgpetersenii serovar Hardjo-bovis str. Sponselee]